MLPAAAEGRRANVQDLELTLDNRECWLTAVINKKVGGYIYRVTFTGSRMNWRAYILIPEQFVLEDTKEDWEELYNQEPRGPGRLNIEVPIPGVARFGRKILAVKGEEFMMRVHVQIEDRNFEGECFMPTDGTAMEEAIAKARDELDAVKSIEKQQEEAPERRTVEFRLKPVRNRKAEVVIYSVEGDEVEYDGKVAIKKLEKKNGRFEIVLEVDVDDDGVAFLGGDMDENMKRIRLEWVEPGSW